MKVAVLLLILAISMNVNTQSTVNHLQQCIGEVRLIAELTLNTLDGAVNMDAMKVIAEGAQIVQEALKVKGVCSKIVRDDALMWLDQHTTAGQKVCVSNVLGMLMEIPQLKEALHNPDLSWQEKMKAFSPIVEKSEKIAEACIPEA